MDDGEAAQTGQCQECKLKPWKYKCPGCSRRTCSLPCVKAHKETSGCTGKKPFNDVVPISQFDDNLLLSDYNMLEDVKRVADSAKKMSDRFCCYPQFWLPYPLHSLKRAASSRRTTLLFLPPGMSKREKNLSSYNNRKKFISWTIEWQFHCEKDVVLMDHRVHEDTNLRSLIEKHLNLGPWKHPLKQFCNMPLDSLKFFIRKHHKGHKSPYIQLDINVPLREQLCNLIILEYPVIHVFLPTLAIEFEVIKKPIPEQVKPKEVINNHSPSSPKGVTFKEEEIEDDESSDPRQCPHVSYPINNADNVEIVTPTTSSVEEKGSEEQSVQDVPSDREDSGAMDLAFLDNMAFEFDAKLIDTYTDLIAESNPDACLDGSSTDPQYLFDGSWDDFCTGMLPGNEELEEGEIAP
ncbi:unnamed protein product [Cuscuta epithymum]|uniref:Box C/D snoRNA protein 1 n=1 Tax=Cuscuta epithymum TaxID=186058 RepID=A0AAV0EFN6_9ASTE|nr:unnamed protein product [Cuscuta epithymum]